MDLEKQLLPGSFEHAVHHLLDHEFDLSRFDTRYRAASGAPSPNWAQPNRIIKKPTGVNGGFWGKGIC